MRRIAVSLAIGRWGVLAINMMSPGVIARNGHFKGEDYSHFYVLGRLAREGRVEYLYDMAEQGRYMATAIPGAPLTYFVPVYGPQVALAFSPLAAMPYLPSLALWSAITIAVYFACCGAVTRVCPMLRDRKRDIALLLMASPALWQLVVHGQNSIVALGAVTIGWLWLKKGRFFLSGLAFGLLFYKPQLGIALAVALIFTWRWQVLAGMAASAAAQLSVAAIFLGSESVEAYARMVMRLPQLAPALEPKPFLLHSFHSFFSGIGPLTPYAVALSLVCSTAVLVRAIAHWRSMKDPDISFAVLLIATLLISPHTSVYDLVLLTPSLLLIVDRMLTAKTDRGLDWVLVATAFGLPLFPGAALYLYIQPSVICLTWLLFRTSRLPVPELAPATV